jgi:chromosomal replication initiation ATPase DnaA
MALEVLRDRLSPLQFDVLIRPAALIGIESDGTLVLGAPNQVLCRRLQQQAVKVVQAVLEELLGRPVTLATVVAQEWRERRAGS